MPSFLLLQAGTDRLRLQAGTDLLLLQADDDAPAAVGPLQSLTWREWNKTITHRDGGPTVGRLEYKQHAEDPGSGFYWYDVAGQNLIDFTGYTFTVKVHDHATTLITKTSGITGAAGSGTNPTGTPNIVIAWAVGELNVAPGDYTIELTPTAPNGRQRDPITAPFRIEASAP